MPLAFIVIFFGCATVPVISGYSSFYYSFPQPTVYSEQAPFETFTHHSTPFYAPLFNQIPTNNARVFVYSSQNAITSNLPNQNQQLISTNPYHGFVYRTHLGDEATSNVFFLAGSDAHKQNQIQKFIMSARNNMDQQYTPKADLENVAYEKIPVSDIMQEIFGKQPMDFQYIYNSNALPSALIGRSLSDNLPLNQQLRDETAKPNITSTTESPTNSKESTTETESHTSKLEITTATETTPKPTTK